MLLVVLTAVVAGYTPYFGTLLGQVGGLTDALQAFVLPPLIYLSMHSEGLSGLQRLSYRLIFVWGVCTITYTVVSLFHMMIWRMLLLCVCGARCSSNSSSTGVIVDIVYWAGFVEREEWMNEWFICVNYGIDQIQIFTEHMSSLPIIQYYNNNTCLFDSSEPRLKN